MANQTSPATLRPIKQATVGAWGGGEMAVLETASQMQLGLFARFISSRANARITMALCGTYVQARCAVAAMASQV